MAQRSREFAVRMALGADAGHIRRRVLSSAATRAAAGIAIGVAAAAAITRAMRALLFGVEPLDGTTYALVIAVVSVTVLAASLLPASRAAGIDPAYVLKRE